MCYLDLWPADTQLDVASGYACGYRADLPGFGEGKVDMATNRRKIMGLLWAHNGLYMAVLACVIVRRVPKPRPQNRPILTRQGGWHCRGSDVGGSNAVLAIPLAFKRIYIIFK